MSAVAGTRMMATTRIKTTMTMTDDNKKQSSSAVTTALVALFVKSDGGRRPETGRQHQREGRTSWQWLRRSCTMPPS